MNLTGVGVNMDYIYGEISQKADAIIYTGKETDSASTVVNNADNSIGVDVKKEHIRELYVEFISDLDNEDTVVKNQFVTAVHQTNGKVDDIERRTLEVDDIPELPTSKITNLPSTIQDVSDSLNKLGERIDNLNADEVTFKNGEVLESISEEKGKISVTKRTLTDSDIPILPKSKVLNLTSDLESLEETKQDNLGFEESETYPYDLDKNKVITKLYLDKRLETLPHVLHFRGKFNKIEGKTEIETLQIKITDPAEGDIAIVDVKEFIYAQIDSSTELAWQELGDETIYAIKGEIVDSDIKANAEIEQSKIKNLINDLEIINQEIDTKQDIIDENNKLNVEYVSGLHKVATSGKYTDLLKTPTMSIDIDNHKIVFESYTN
jgi:hypothetical protein